MITVKVAKGSGDSKLLLKPPRILSKTTTLPSVQSRKDSTGNTQIKNNARRISSGI